MTREEQIDWLCRLRADLNNGVIFTPWNKELTEALNDVLEQEPKGHWEIKDKMWWVCSACGCQTRMMKKYNVPNFCPACGADMREVEDETN